MALTSAASGNPAADRRGGRARSPDDRASSAGDRGPPGGDRALPGGGRTHFEGDRARSREDHAPAGDLPSSPPDSAVLVLLSAVGDVVHGMPLATSLKEAWPDCRLTWVIHPGPRELVARHPDVDEFLAVRRFRGVDAVRSPLGFRRRVRGRRFGLVLTPQVYLKAGLLTAALDAPVKLGFDRGRASDLHGLFLTHRLPPREPAEPPPGRAHVQEHYFDFLRHLGVPIVREWRFGFTAREEEARRRFFDRIEGPALGVVLKTTEAARDWPPDRYARVLEAAEFDLGLTPVLVGSRAPAERAAAREVLSRTRASPVDAMEDDLRRLAWILDGCDLVLSPDTGPLHAADALGTPVVGLYGATDPRVKGPYRPEHRSLAVDRFRRPGEEIAPSREKRPGRMEEISAPEVVGRLEVAAERFVDGGRASP